MQGDDGVLFFLNAWWWYYWKCVEAAQACSHSIKQTHNHMETHINLGWCPVQILKGWNPFIWFLSVLSKWDQMWKKKPKQPGKGGQRQMVLKSHDFQVSEGKCLRCTYALTSRHERNTTGERERDSWVPQGSSEPQEPHAVSNCYENPGSTSETNYLHGKLSLFWSSSLQRLQCGFLI